jgi:hypothetical protein
MTASLNTYGQQFADALAAATIRRDRDAAQANDGEKLHVTGAGRTLTFAYEQLRNAAEYTEEHLLLQRAIRRFYRRAFLARDDKSVGQSGEELIVELTLAGYLENDSVKVETVEKVNTLASDYYKAHSRRLKEAWTLDVLAVEVERLLSADPRRDVFTQFAYAHFLETINPDKLFKTRPKDFEIELFVAVHRALLKSDTATIRTALLGRYQQTPAMETYAATNKMIDKVLDSPTTDQVYRLVNRRGAPFRVLWRLIDEHEDTARLLARREQFLTAYEAQIQTEYSQINGRINRGIVKSVAFLFITKALIGLAIEIPYDYFAHGAILWTVLWINLLFPPLYMVLLRGTLRLPGPANSQALVDTIETLLYSDKQLAMAGRPNKGYGVAFNVIYALLIIGVFGAAAFGLMQLGFSVVHLVIFFVFLSTASFLGFRLSRQIREIEVVDGAQDGVSMLRDFLYMPFVVVGRWMSEKYAKVNIVAMILDMVIELPLKTILHLVRQWGNFITSKKDEL